MSKWSLVDHLTSNLAQGRLGEPKHPTLWPSEASAVVQNQWGEKKVVGKCRRSTYFRYAQACYEFYSEYSHLQPLIEEITVKQIPTQPYQYWLWAAGDLYEDYVINLAQASGVYIAAQVPIYVKDHNISGKVDLIALNPDSFKRTVTEVKSVYGHNGNTVLGSQYDRRTGQLGRPRDSNLMQIAIYDWHFATPKEDYEYSRLLYGSRDTGRYAEYSVRTEYDEATGVTKIYYAGIAPNKTQEVESPITIDSILHDGYGYVVNHLLSGTIPERDFDLRYSEEKIQTMYDRHEQLPKMERLSKKDHEQITKIKARAELNIEREAEGKKPLKPLKPVEKGDWQCNLCKYKNVCYNPDNSPRSL